MLHVGSPFHQRIVFSRDNCSQSIVGYHFHSLRSVWGLSLLVGTQLNAYCTLTGSHTCTCVCACVCVLYLYVVVCVVQGVRFFGG